MIPVNIPASVRFGLYLLSAIGSVVVSYLLATDRIGEAETAAWAGLVSIISALAAAKTPLTERSQTTVLLEGPRDGAL